MNKIIRIFTNDGEQFEFIGVNKLSFTENNISFEYYDKECWCRNKAKFFNISGYIIVGI